MRASEVEVEREDPPCHRAQGAQIETFPARLELSVPDPEPDFRRFPGADFPVSVENSRLPVVLKRRKAVPAVRADDGVERKGGGKRDAGEHAPGPDYEAFFSSVTGASAGS